MASTEAEALLISNALSAARMSTYQNATAPAGTMLAALGLYGWNAEVSAGLLTPLHICEVAIRNAVAQALEAQYGARWPWSPGFERSLPNPAPPAYNPTRDLRLARSKYATTGKVIPELKFAFWQHMFTSRHDLRLWTPHLRTVLPNLPVDSTIAALRQQIFRDLESIRLLRNRIAHHEPIFTRNLAADLGKVMVLTYYRCEKTVNWSWYLGAQNAAQIIQRRP